MAGKLDKKMPVSFLAHFFLPVLRERLAVVSCGKITVNGNVVIVKIIRPENGC
jgi:hypothetical protein